MTTKKRKIVAAISQQERTEARNKEWEAIEKEDREYSITDDQLDTIIGELIDTLDQHLIESAFNFRENLDAIHSPYWSTRDYLEGFIDKLNPYAQHLKEKLFAAGLYDDYNSQFPGVPEEDLTGLIRALRECSFIIGCFMGAKLAGASQERLQMMRKYLVL